MGPIKKAMRRSYPNTEPRALLFVVRAPIYMTGYELPRPVVVEFTDKVMLPERRFSGVHGGPLTRRNK